MTEFLRVSVGRYTVIADDEGGLRALRYGEEWRDLTGDKLIFSLAVEVERLRKELVEKGFPEAAKE